MSGDRRELPRNYATWKGMPVFLKITAGELKTSLFCTVIGESDATVRVRIADRWDVDIYKDMILVVDAFPHTSIDLAPQHPGKFNETAWLAQRPATAMVQP